MFKRLVSNLPFNPSLINQVIFYAQRLRQEALIRRLGVGMLLIGLIIQSLAIISPPQSSTARSGNDLLEGGFSTKNDAVSFCQQNVGNYQTILSFYDISCDNLAAAQEQVTLKATDYGSQLMSMGRQPYGIAGETKVVVNGQTYYYRFLWGWGKNVKYQALSGFSNSGRQFFILYDCGNLVFIGVPAPPAKCIWDPTIFSTDARCQKPVCKLNPALSADDSSCVGCLYDQTISKHDPRCVVCPNPRHSNVTAGSPSCLKICQYNQGLDSNSDSCKPCSASQTQEDKTSCLEFSKTVSNLTSGLKDANGSTAKPSEVLEYHLLTKNDSPAGINDYLIQDNISDILDYADLADGSGAQLDANHNLIWPKITIPGNQTVVKSFKVKVKNPIPNTPASLSDPEHFNLLMRNVYGTAISVKVPGSIVKTTEIATTALPNTGPGDTLVIGFLLTSLAGYLFARTRLFQRELEIIGHNHGHGGSHERN